MVDSYIRSCMTIGMGASSKLCRSVISYVGEKLLQGTLKDIKAVPASSLAASEASFAGIPLTSLTEHPKLEFAFDGADEVDNNIGTLPVIKGRRRSPVQPNLLLERKIAAAAEMYVVLVDDDNVVDALGGEVPILVESEIWEDVAEELDDIFIGDASIWRRPESGRAPPHGGEQPMMTLEKHNMLDLTFDGALPEKAEDIAKAIEGVEGAVDHGLFIDMVYAAVTIGKDGFRTLSPFLKGVEVTDFEP